MDQMENRPESLSNTIRTWQTMSQEEKDAEAIQKLKERKGKEPPVIP
jgi:hypothetical protein